MKKLVLYIYFLTLCYSLFSQNGNNEINTLLGENFKITGFGGPLINLTTIDKDLSVIIGGGGGVIFNDQLFIGGFGEGLANSIKLDKEVYKDQKMELGYGGLWLGYIISGKTAIHPVLSTRIGWGSVKFEDNQYFRVSDDNILTVIPSLEVEANLTRFMRFSIGGYYRFVDGIDLINLDDSMFSAPGGYISFKFGWF